MSILSILSGFFIANVNDTQKRARDQQRKSELKQVQSAFEQFRSDEGGYAYFSDGDRAGTGWAAPSGLTGGINAVTLKQMGLTTPTAYMTKIPVDPNGDACGYLYYHDDTRQKYTLFAKLENTNDSEAKANKILPVIGAPGSCVVGSCQQFRITSGTCIGTIYNYWVNSPY